MVKGIDYTLAFYCQEIAKGIDYTLAFIAKKLQKVSVISFFIRL
jgi:hypothetical protein